MCPYAIFSKDWVCRIEQFYGPGPKNFCVLNGRGIVLYPATLEDKYYYKIHSIDSIPDFVIHKDVIPTNNKPVCKGDHLIPGICRLRTAMLSPAVEVITDNTINGVYIEIYYPDKYNAIKDQRVCIAAIVVYPNSENPKVHCIGEKFERGAVVARIDFPTRATNCCPYPTNNINCCNKIIADVSVYYALVLKDAIPPADYYIDDLLQMVAGNRNFNIMIAIILAIFCMIMFI